MDYRARFYHPVLARFIQPDTLIPDPSNPQAFNRYSYVANRPVNFNDPSGHDPWWCEGDDLCMYDWFNTHTTTGGDSYFAEYGVELHGEWDAYHKRAVIGAISKIGSKFATERGRGETAAQAFKAIYGYVTITWDKNCYYCRTPKQIRECGNNFAGSCAAGGGLTTGAHSITFASMTGEGRHDTFRSILNVVHEFGHVYDNLLGFGPRNDMPADFWRNRARILHPNIDRASGKPCDECLLWQQNRTPSPTETFADMFIAWTYDVWNTVPDNALIVSQAQDWMNKWMP